MLKLKFFSTGYNFLIKLLLTAILILVLIITSGHWVAFLITFLLWLSINSYWFGTGYYLNEKWLLIQFGIFYRRRISINSIHSIWKSTKLIKVPTSSFRKLKIHFNDDAIIILPASEKSFLDHIKILNPNIQIKLKDWDKGNEVI